MSTPPVVLCEWEDATILDHGPWTVPPESAEYTPRIFLQVGFLVGDQPEGIQLSEAWSDGCIAPRTQIPRGMIRRLVHLTPKKGRR